METTKMKKVIALMALLATVAGLASCSKSELYIYECGYGHEGESNAEPCYLSVSDVETEKYAATRTITEKTEFANGDVLGIWVVDASGSTYNGATYSNVTLTKENDVWKLGQHIPLSTDNAKLYALFPYQSTMTDKIVQLSVDDETDYLFGKAEKISKTQPTASLTMSHIRSELIVRIKRGTYVGTGEISEGTITGSSLVLNGTFNMSEEKFYEATDAETPQLSVSGTLDGENVIERRWFVFSKFGGTTSSLYFNLTIDGVSSQIRSNNPVKFEKSKQYIYNITIDTQGIEVKEETTVIDPWENDREENIEVVY